MLDEVKTKFWIFWAPVQVTRTLQIRRRHICDNVEWPHNAGRAMSTERKVTVLPLRTVNFANIT